MLVLKLTFLNERTCAPSSSFQFRGTNHPFLKKDEESVPYKPGRDYSIFVKIRKVICLAPSLETLAKNWLSQRGREIQAVSFN